MEVLYHIFGHILWGYYPSKIGHWLMVFCDFKMIYPNFQDLKSVHWWTTPEIDWPQPRTGHRHLTMSDGDMDGYGYQVRPFFVSKLRYLQPSSKKWVKIRCSKWIHTKNGHRMSQNHRIWAFGGLIYWWRLMGMICRWPIVIIVDWWSRVIPSPDWLPAPLMLL